MSKETFETEWNSKAVNFYASDPVEMIEKHGGRIVWPSEPKEPPPPAVCMCPDDWQDRNFVTDKPGPWHLTECPFSVPF